MPSDTPILDLPFVIGTDALSDYPALSQALAERIEALLGAIPLGEIVLGASGASIDIPAIPADADDLLIVSSLRVTAATREARLRFNGDTTASYRDLPGGAADVTSIFTGYPAISTMPAGVTAPTLILVPRYAAAVPSSVMAATMNHNVYPVGGSIYGGHYKPATPITQVTLLPSGDQFAAGSSVALYGLRR